VSQVVSRSGSRDRIVRRRRITPGVGLALGLGLVGAHLGSRGRRPRHRARIEALDPTVDHEQIARISAQLEFPWDTETALSLALFRTFAVPSISTVLAGSRAFLDAPRRRYDDTELLLAEMQEHGVASERGRAALRRVNRMHAAYDLRDDDLRYVLSTFVVQPDDWIARFGWRELTAVEREAAWRFWREVGRRMGVRELPDDREELVAWSRDYEARRFAPHPANNAVADTTMTMYLAEVLHVPASLHRFARPALLALLEPDLVAALGYPAPPRWLRRFVPAALAVRARLLAWFVPPRRRPVRLTQRPRPGYPHGYRIAELGTFPDRTASPSAPVGGSVGPRRHHRVDTGEVVLDVEVLGPTGPTSNARAPRTPVLLVSGLGAQRIDWPPGLVAALREAGHEVVTFDHRDAGASSGCDTRPGDADDLDRWRDGLPFRVPYRLQDLAEDAVAILDHLGIASAHVIGRSMGGMVAQRLALHAPERVRSLTSMQSTTGAPDVGQPTDAAMDALAVETPPRRDTVIEAGLARTRITGSPGLIDDDAVRQRIGTAFDRAYRPAGTTRQLLAILAEEDRTPLLRDIVAPTLVVHGDADTLVPVSGGRATAAAIPGAQLVEIPGLGHDLPDALLPRVAAAIVDHLEAVER
jgi:pimeloyl-ACP methyl ester carboxylesterase